VGVVAALTVLGILTGIGIRPSWEMELDVQPPTAEEVGTGEGPLWSGAQAFHERGCGHCHVVFGRGGRYGPELSDVALRLPRGEIVTRIVNGVGDMPAYRGIVSERELADIVAFLESLEAR
jgi:mono/diheme cytochrome c family protein